MRLPNPLSCETIARLDKLKFGIKSARNSCRSGVSNVDEYSVGSSKLVDTGSLRLRRLQRTTSSPATVVVWKLSTTST